MIEIVKFNIVGRKPLMQGNPASREKEEAGVIEGAIGKTKLKKATPSFQEAAQLLYATTDGRFYHPMRAFWSAMTFALPNREITSVTPSGKTKRSAASGILPKAIEVEEEYFILCAPASLSKKTPKPLTSSDWVVDRRGVPVQGGKKGSVLASRPKWPVWGGILQFEVDTDVIPMESISVVVEIMNEAGRWGIGVGRLRRDGSNWSGLGMGKFQCELRK